MVDKIGAKVSAILENEANFCTNDKLKMTKQYLRFLGNIRTWNLSDISQYDKKIF